MKNIRERMNEYHELKHRINKAMKNKKRREAKAKELFRYGDIIDDIRNKSDNTRDLMIVDDDVRLWYVHMHNGEVESVTYAQ